MRPLDAVTDVPDQDAAAALHWGDEDELPPTRRKRVRSKRLAGTPDEHEGRANIGVALQPGIAERVRTSIAPGSARVAADATSPNIVDLTVDGAGSVTVKTEPDETTGLGAAHDTDFDLRIRELEIIRDFKLGMVKIEREKRAHAAANRTQ